MREKQVVLLGEHARLVVRNFVHLNIRIIVLKTVMLKQVHQLKHQQNHGLFIKKIDQEVVTQLKNVNIVITDLRVILMEKVIQVDVDRKSTRLNSSHANI